MLENSELDIISFSAARLLIINDNEGREYNDPLSNKQQIHVIDLYNSSFQCELPFHQPLDSSNSVGAFTKSGPIVCGEKGGWWGYYQCYGLNSTRQFEPIFPIRFSDRELPEISEVCGNFFEN